MSNKTDGGAAFPITRESSFCTNYEGMRLRDYFAAKAMQGFCADSQTAGRNGFELAEEAYQVADAMLAARGGS